jgi:adenine phosphoribosyltransferase
MEINQNIHERKNIGMDLKSYIKDVPNHPKEGILFKDIQPLLGDPHAFKTAIVNMKQLSNFVGVDYWVGIESRGFIFASAIAEHSYSGFKMIRKAGKLPPNNTVSIEYGLEYGRDTIEMEKGSGKVIIVDDVYATGGTMTAAKLICELAGYEVIDTLCLVDIGLVKNHDTKCLISY